MKEREKERKKERNPDWTENKVLLFAVPCMRMRLVGHVESIEKRIMHTKFGQKLEWNIWVPDMEMYE